MMPMVFMARASGFVSCIIPPNGRRVARSFQGKHFSKFKELLNSSLDFRPLKIYKIGEIIDLVCFLSQYKYR